MEPRSQNLFSQLPWIVAITGASGTVYARRMLQVVAEYLPDVQLELVISDAAFRVMQEEDGLRLGRRRVKVQDLVGRDAPNIRIHDSRDIGASIASGSYETAGMIVAPCSMSTLAAISCGLGDNLIHRAADVVLKEGRRLILVPRETPLSTIQIENMLKLSRLGVTVLPAMPGFYHQPATIAELVEMLVMRMLDQMGLGRKLSMAREEVGASGSLVRRWEPGRQDADDIEIEKGEQCRVRRLKF